MQAATAKRVRYASGYIGLKLLNEASDELEAIAYEDRFIPEVLSVRIDLHMAAKHWETVIGLGHRLANDCPHQFQGWMAWAYALHEMKRTGEARAVLIDAEPHHGKAAALLHYNLACYECTLGSLAEARKRLQKACQMDADFKQAALEDPDLKALWGDVDDTR